MVQAAESDYQIVVSSEADDKELLAANELRLFFKEATGVTLPIINDIGLEHSSSNRYISVGKNALSASAGVTEPNVKEQGYKIQTVDYTLFLLGKSSYGTLYSVYDYLGLTFNYEYYFTDVYSLDKDISYLVFKEINLTNQPAIDVFSSPNAGFVWHNEVNRNRFRCVNTSEWAIPANGNTGVHNIFDIINPDTFGESNSAWFDDEKKNACFSAHGNQAEYSAMQSEFLSVIQKGLKQSGNDIFTISQNDNSGFCDCETCASIAAEYGASSAVLVKFCNDLVQKVYAWFDTSEGLSYKRDFYLYFLAYQACLDAPDASKIQMDSKVGVWLAMDGFKGIFGVQELTNADLYNNILKWDTLTDNFMFWLYDVNFAEYFCPYDTSVYKADFYKLMSELGVSVVNDQSQNLNKIQGTAWNNLKNYLSSKLRWNVNLDEDELVKAFMESCYHGAADTMYGIYLSQQQNWATARAKILSGELSVNTNLYGGIHFTEMLDTRVFSYDTLNGWYNSFLTALNQIKPLEATDKAAYDKAYSMICAEIASPLYMLFKMYSAELAQEYDLATLKADFKIYCTVGNVSYYKGGASTGAITSLYAELGIN